MTTPEILTSPYFLFSAGLIVITAVVAVFATGSWRHLSHRGSRFHRGAQGDSSPRVPVPSGMAASSAHLTKPVRTLAGSARPEVEKASKGHKGVHVEAPKVGFDDVAGADEAVAELREIKEFLLDPERFRALGAALPRGVLLVGPPGTGKTLLARALAGEANVPFFVASAASFVEVYVGVGASRVRQLFEEARKNAPAIVFIDEIDAVGRARSARAMGGQEERESTLNQLLLEMDGFETGPAVIVVGATNRPDVLDSALLRPGRFDRRITVDRPDLRGRQAILRVHSRGKPLGPDADLNLVARRTPGFVGADLANLMNEGALLAGRHARRYITMRDLEEATERVLAGPERRSRVLSDREKRMVAFHEAGHALLSWALSQSNDVHKVSIVSRGQAHGYTISLPVEDRVLVTRSELVDQLAVLLGGRVAEELVFSDVTTGAQDDLERATSLAQKMVLEYGMSERLGPLSLSLVTDGGRQALQGAEVAAEADAEIRRLLTEAQQEARELLCRHAEVLDDLADELVQRECLDREDLEEILLPVVKRRDRASAAPAWAAFGAGGGRVSA